MTEYANPFNLVTDDNGIPVGCFWDNCILSAGPLFGFPTLSCLSGFEFSCEDCRCIPTGEINNKPLSAFNFEIPDEWLFTVSWEMKNKERNKDVDVYGLPFSTLSAVAYDNSPVDSYAATAIARYDARRKNYKVDVVTDSIVNALSATPWAGEKVFENLRLSTDVFYNQDYVELLHSSQTGGACNNDIEYIKFWFDGEAPAQVVDRDFARRNAHLTFPWEDSTSTPLEDIVEGQAEVNKYLQGAAKKYARVVRQRKKQGFGEVETPFTRNIGLSSVKDYINESLVLHGVNSVEHSDNVNAFLESAKIYTKLRTDEVKSYRNRPMDDGVANFEDGFIARDQFGKFITKIEKDSYRTTFITNGDEFLSSELDDSVKVLLEPGGVLSGYGPGGLIDRNKTWNDSVRVPKTVWTEVDMLFTPVYTVLSSISSSYWPVSALSGTVTEAYIDHLNRLYPDEIPAGEIIEPSFLYLILSSYPTLSSYARINTLSAAAANPWWNPSFLTHVSFVSGGKIGSRNVVSLAYNKIDLNEGADVGNTTLLSYGDTLIEVNNAYNGALMGLVLDDYEVEPFTVDINNPEIVLESGYVSGVTDGAKAARLLGFI